MESLRLLLEEYLKQHPLRNVHNTTQRLTSILKADIWMAIQLGLNEIKEQLFSLIGEFQQKLLNEVSALNPTHLQMFTHGLHDHDRGASGKLVYQELLTDLEKAIQDHASVFFQKIKQDVQAYNFSAAIPTVHNTRPSATASSATEVLKEEYPSGVSFGIADRTLDGDSTVVSHTAISSCTSAYHET